MFRLKAALGGLIVGLVVSIAFVAVMSALQPELLFTDGMFNGRTFLGIGLTGLLVATALAIEAKE
jgi:hypothetical protein